MKTKEAKKALDRVIKKARVHLYKPIQVAEILYHDRVKGEIDLSKLSTYRNPSKIWRDAICKKFLGRTSTSSQKYQDDLFNKHAVPPEALVALGKINREKKGIVESYIYNRFMDKQSQLTAALTYCKAKTIEDFNLNEFMSLFWHEAGLKRSIDKIFEIVVYALFQALIEQLDVSVTLSIENCDRELIAEFRDFTEKILGLNQKELTRVVTASFHRVGVTNAADRGLDMWANYGPAIQIKHLTLDLELAEEITSTVTADRIIIVCVDAEKDTILSILKQVGWQSRIQAVVVQSELEGWYDKALRGKFKSTLGKHILEILNDEIVAEFPAQAENELQDFMNSRGYDLTVDDF